MTPLTIIALVYGACAVVALGFLVFCDIPDEYELWPEGVDDPRPGELITFHNESK